MKKFRMLLVALALIACFLPATAEDEPEKTTLVDVATTLTYPSFWHTPFGIHRGTPFWLKVFLGNRTYFSDPQGVAATKLLVDYGKIREGKDDWQLTVYGVNSGRSEVIYNSSMHSLDIFGGEGTEDGKLMRPIGIACNENGDIYVADTGNNRVSRFYNDGKKVKFLLNLGGPGAEPGKFNKPTYVALDSGGKLYVSDTGNNRIQVFSKSGGVLREFGKASGVLNPQGICVSDKFERYTGYRQDYIFIVDANNNRIQKFTHEGKPVQSMRVNELLQKEVFLTTLDMDYYGNLFVVDKLNSSIHKFTSDLLYIDSFGNYGTNDYQFEHPTGIAIYKHFGQVFISDRESAQYFWIGSDIKYLDSEHRKLNGAEQFYIEFFLTEKGYVTVKTLGEEEKEVVICDKMELDMGKNAISWNIPDLYIDTVFKRGKPYTFDIRVSSTYSSYPHIEKQIKNIVVFR